MPHLRQKLFTLRANPVRSPEPRFRQCIIQQVMPLKMCRTVRKNVQSTEYGHCYTRVSNPTVANFEAKIAALENGEAAVAFGSGVAAISGIMLHFLKAGDHAIVDTTSYSATHYLFDSLLRKFGVETSFVNTSHLENIRQAMRPETRIIHVESPANPTLKLVDLKGVAEIAKAAQITTVIDSTFATPYIQRPLEMGIDIVVA